MEEFENELNDTNKVQIDIIEEFKKRQQSAAQNKPTIRVFFYNI